MRMRATLTGLLTVILLSLSSIPSVCEVGCSLTQGKPDCHHSQPADVQMSAMAGMQAHTSCCGTATSASTSAACEHQACVTQPALTSERFHFIAPVAPTLTLALADIGKLQPLLLERSTPVRGPPRFPKHSPVSLHTTQLV
ncbi:MAG: hypothetical protein M3Y50_14630 [Acidobacteriota bacterium]|nr:hypothetical protein [Acidobacteriota bacterium]